MSESTYDEGERLKQEGIKTSYRNADTTWRRAADKRVYELARNRMSFTSDDVIAYLDSKEIFTPNNSALGGVMLAAHRAGLITPTGEFTESKRPQRHKAPLRIWQSNLWEKRHAKGR